MSPPSSNNLQTCRPDQKRTAPKSTKHLLTCRPNLRTCRPRHRNVRTYGPNLQTCRLDLQKIRAHRSNQKKSCEHVSLIKNKSADMLPQVGNTSSQSVNICPNQQKNLQTHHPDLQTCRPNLQTVCEHVGPLLRTCHPNLPEMCDGTIGTSTAVDTTMRQRRLSYHM